ncbi:hypothetical protein A2U01_0068136, partial [Trifolium medium]|nr:hypothetical protein [Trifolium medium]
HVVGLKVAAVGSNPSANLSSPNVTWPSSGLPVEYTHSGYMHSSNERSAAAQVIQVPMGTGTEFAANRPRAHQVLPRDVVPQKSQGDP